MAIGYRGRHLRVQRARGSANEHACVDGCGRQAEEWAQIHGTDGADPEHYVPRCVKCHRAYDGTHAKPGEQNHNAILTEAQARGIWASVGATRRELAEHFGVSAAAIKDIRLGRNWKHITRGRRADC